MTPATKAAARARPAEAFAHAEELARRWQSRMVSAAQQARLAGRLNDSWLRRVEACRRAPAALAPCWRVT